MNCIRLIAAPTLITLILCTSALAENHDTTEFQVESYIPDKFTDFEWKLDGGFDLRGDALDSDRNFHQGVYRNDHSVDVRESSYGDLAFGSDWRYRHETRQAIWDLNFYFDLGYDGFTAISDGNVLDTLGYPTFRTAENGSESHLIGGGFSGEGRRFVWGDKFFSWHLAWDYGYDGSSYWSESEEERYFYESSGNAERFIHDRKERNGHAQKRTFNLNGELLIGRGRIYEGRYATTAMFMIDELKARGLLLRNPSTGHMWEFTKLVHASRLQYRIDEREHRALVLDNLLSFLIERQYLEADKAAALFVIEDVWDYFPRRERRFGSDFQFGFGGSDAYENSDWSTDIESYRLSTRAYRDSAGQIDTIDWYDNRVVETNDENHFWTDDYFLLRLRRCRPLSLRWQWDLSTDLVWHVNKRYEIDDPEDGNKWYWHNWREVAVTSELTYFHDARTEISFVTQFTSKWKEDLLFRPSKGRFTGIWSWATFRTEERALAAEIQAQVLYRISVPTQLKLTWSHHRKHRDIWHYQYNQHLDTHDFRLTASIIHWLY